MKTAIRYLAAAVVAALLGGVSLAGGWLQRDIAHAQQEVAAQNYDQADTAFETAERYFEYGSRIPGVGRALLNDVRARRAALHYWRRDYGMLAPPQDDPMGAIPTDNVDLQFVVANAVYRSRQGQARDRASTLQALNAGINAYLVVLKSSARREDAAFNYEYLVRMRDELERGRRKPGLTDEANSPFGRAASPERPTSNMKDFKTLVPLSPTELDKAAAGTGAPIKRKG